MTITTYVQGAAKKADAMESDVEYVLTELMPQKLANLTEHDFERLKGSMVEKLLQAPRTMSDEFGHFWGPISEGHKECFDLRDEMLRYIRSNQAKLSKQELIDSWKALASPSSPAATRKKLVVKYFAGSVPTRPTEKELEDAWKKVGMSETTMKLLSREYKETVLIHKADSAARAKIAKKGGYFSREIRCTAKPPPRKRPKPLHLSSSAASSLEETPTSTQDVVTLAIDSAAVMVPASKHLHPEPGIVQVAITSS
eukprot:gnl/TRDRNA2_/TRDRNA2_170449_c0_seq1.p1 gnl/TRDRNA2_/TRDRNA2_170449_c0~~gnl/TRDRNA2_/TRDRNA2_170449_c0_seq1.p1  ORF type:complete len:255 (-),score=64.27 gnl/TRDRNA2_/TRDRNA2_170449_c0_seq1:23-787(-)